MTVKVLEDEKIVAVKTGGSTFTKHKPLFSVDERFLLCVCGNEIRVFSVDTGECCQVLHGHASAITGIAHHPQNRLQVITCSDDGYVKRWDYEDGEQLASYKFDTSLGAILTSFTFPDKIFLACCPSAPGKNGDNAWELRSFEISARREDEEKMDEDKSCEVGTTLFPLPNQQLVTISERCLIACNKREIVFHDLQLATQVRHKLKRNDPAITCVSIHPHHQDQCVTGHRNGEIRFWMGMGTAEGGTFNRQHWHSSAVASVSWTGAGDVMSGGSEGVLVQWKQHDKYFMPRLGPIRHVVVSPGNKLRATLHADNSVKIITSFSTVQQVIEGFTATSQELHCGIACDPITSSLVTNGKLGHLLFYQPQQDFQLMNFDVISGNFASSPDPKHQLSRVHITKLQFLQVDNETVFMATVEQDEVKMRDQKLKFWKYDFAAKNWCLDTLVTSPHNDEPVTSLSFHPRHAVCVTTSRDCLAKVWNCDDTKNGGWSGMGAISHKQLECGEGCFSEDGSLLALAFQHQVLLLDSTTFQQRDNLSHRHSVSSLKFGANSCNRYLLTLTSHHLYSWDVVAGHVAWCSDLTMTSRPPLLISDPRSNKIAVFLADEQEGSKATTTVRIVRPDTSQPISVSKLDLNFASASFHPTEQQSRDHSSQLYVVSKEMTVYKLCSEKEAVEHEMRRIREMKTTTGLKEVENSNLLTPMSLYINSSSAAQDADDVTKPLQPNYTLPHKTMQDAVSSIINSPAHSQVPIKLLVDRFITSLVMQDRLHGNDAGANSRPMETDDDITASSKKTHDVTKAMTSHQRKQVVKSENFNFLTAFYPRHGKNEI